MRFSLTLFNRVPGAGQTLQKTWRDAASIIMVHGNGSTSTSSTVLNPSETSKPKYLMMQRSEGSSFMPGGLCYPGGTVSQADSSKSWIDLFKKTHPMQIDIEKLSFLHPNAHIPQIYHDASDTESISNELPRQVLLRITAIRELFEECGILVCEPDANLISLQNDKSQLKDWQVKVKNEPDEFIELCSIYQVVPKLFALVDWSNWLTPVTYGSPKRRFDTIFYMTIVEKIPEVLTDDHEVAGTMWSTAAQYLEDDALGKRKLMPPQAYEMSRLSSLSVSDLKRLMVLRMKLGIERWCPFLYKTKDSLIGSLPGDDLYPKNPDVYTLGDFVSLDSTVEQLELTTTNHHRWIIGKNSKRKLSINISDRYGHVYT